MDKAIYLDMDGTFVNLYGVENWLEMLVNNDPTPYRVAKPLVDFNELAKVLNMAQCNGWKIGIVTWLAKNSNEDYDKAVTETKLEYIAKNLPTVHFNEIRVVKYGTPKGTVVTNKNGVLFDDEEKNRLDWFGTAYDVQNLVKQIRELVC